MGIIMMRPNESVAFIEDGICVQLSNSIDFVIKAKEEVDVLEVELGLGGVGKSCDAPMEDLLAIQHKKSTIKEEERVEFVVKANEEMKSS